MKQFLFFLILQGSLFAGIAQNTPAQKNYNIQNNIALDGYDAVSYITRQKAIKGNKQFAVNYQGINYYFASAANKDLFKNNAAAYTPQYGGWCAYAMGNSAEKVSVDPKTFKVVDGKLYLFYNRLFNNTLTEWNKNEAALKKKADANWNKIYHP
jgi:YHS domain-containing protein